MPSSVFKHFLISINDCNSIGADNIRYAILRAAFFGQLSFATVGINLPITTISFRLYAVVTIVTPTTDTRVRSLLYLSQSTTVVPTSIDFTSEFVSTSFIPLLQYGSLERKSDTSSSESLPDDMSDISNFGDGGNRVVEFVAEGFFDLPEEHVMLDLPQDELEHFGPLDELQVDPGDNLPDNDSESDSTGLLSDGSESDSTGILSVGTFYNEGTEMADFNARVNELMQGNPPAYQAYLRALRALERSTNPTLATLLADKLCIVCRNKIVAGVHNVKLGLECVRCHKAQLYHWPCLLSWMLSIHEVPACEYCRSRTRAS